MKRARLRLIALMIALFLLVSALCALPAGAEPLPAGREYYMLSYQMGGYSHGTALATLYGNAQFSGVLFNDGNEVVTSEPGKDALLNGLDAFKTTPDADDITYLYFVGTGYLKDGVAGIQLSGGEELPLTDLSSALVALPGTVCVLLDVKAAGVLPASFNQQVAQAFSADKFQYLSSCSATDAAFGAAPISRATRILLTGFGMNLATGAIKSKNWPADTNKNYSVSLKEAASYLKSQSKKLKTADFGLAYRAAGNGPNLFACTGVTSFKIFTKDPVTTQDYWTSIYLTTTPANADVGSFLISSSKPKVASIDPTDALCAEVHRIGTTVLSARSLWYPYPKASFKLKVQPVHAESIEIEANYKDITGQTVEVLYGDDFEASASVNPWDSDYSRITWKTSNKKVADLEADADGGDVYIDVVGVGTAEITAMTADGCKASFTLIVPHIPVERLYAVEDQILPLHKKTYCGTEPYPHGALRGITYKSSNPAVATIDSRGYIYGKKLGKVTITAISIDNPAARIQYTITIARDESVWPAPDAASLGSGMFFKPKRLSFSGNYLVCEMYFINNTSAPVSQITVGKVGVLCTDDAESYSETRSYLKFLKPVPANSVGTFTFKLDKYEKVSRVQIAYYILPQGRLEPFVTIVKP